MLIHLVLLTLTSFTHKQYGQVKAQIGKELNPCAKEKSCEDCNKNPSCNWCSKPIKDESMSSHCNTPIEHLYQLEREKRCNLEFFSSRTCESKNVQEKGATCDGLKDCVQCKVHLSGEFEDWDICESECLLLNDPNILRVQDDVKIPDKKSGENYCAFTDHLDSCRFYFVFGLKNDLLYINAQRYKDCPPEPPVFWIGTIIIIGVIIVGIFMAILICIFYNLHRRSARRRAKAEQGNLTNLRLI